MDVTLLLLAMILIWIAVIVGLYQRIFEMPKWFANPPASFELIRKQSKKARSFWIPLSLLFIIAISAALVFNWQNVDIRIHILGAIVCFAMTGALSAVYFIKEIIAFTKIPPDAPQTPELMKRVKFWLRWTTVRDVLQLLAALFLSVAYNHV
jgi:hypothetical protein